MVCLWVGRGPGGALGVPCGGGLWWGLWLRYVRAVSISHGTLGRLNWVVDVVVGVLCLWEAGVRRGKEEGVRVILGHKIIQLS